jgi:hypothetical protein
MYYFVRGRDNDDYRLDSDFGVEIKKMLARVLTPDTEITFINPHGDNIDDSWFKHEVPNKRQLTIVNWGYHSNYAEGDTYKRYLQEYELCDDKVYVPLVSEDEIIFTDSKFQVPLAVFDKSKNRLYLLWDALHHRRRSELRMLEHIFTYFASQLTGHPLFSPADEAELEYNKTITFNSKLVTPRLRQLQSEYADAQRYLEEHRRKIAQYITESKVLGVQIEALNNSAGIPSQTIANKWVKHIETTPSGFVVYTNPLFITYINKKKFESMVQHSSKYNKYNNLLGEITKGLGKKYGWYVGQYKIEVNLQENWRIRFHNEDNKRKGYWHSGDYACNHPHVNREGEGCLGNLSELVASTQTSFEIGPLVDVLIQYLQSANLEDPAGSYLYKWDLIDMTTMKDAITGSRLDIIPMRIEITPPNIQDGPMPASEAGDANADGGSSDFQCPDDTDCDSCPHRDVCDERD